VTGDEVVVTSLAGSLDAYRCTSAKHPQQQKPVFQNACLIYANLRHGGCLSSWRIRRLALCLSSFSRPAWFPAFAPRGCPPTHARARLLWVCQVSFGEQLEAGWAKRGSGSSLRRNLEVTSGGARDRKARRVLVGREGWARGTRKRRQRCLEVSCRRLTLSF
jgi:hypothetical protein